MPHPIGLLGGTFDPVHNGHVRTAVEIRERLDLAEVRLIPAGTPPHRHPPVLDGQTRMALVRAAVADVQRLHADDREIARPGPSFTVETLVGLRGAFPDRTFCLAVGMDAFADFLGWHRWREILQLGHICVVDRPGAPFPSGSVGELLTNPPADPARAMTQNRSGIVTRLEIPLLAISATEIRAKRRDGRCIRGLVPDAVADLISEQNLYVNDV